ncbi:MAG: helix-turn-helix transcriptional regulator [Verrucomicrobia bacterium]|nr:helix-turn-helix transcriptional regulator [Verrucomicrobiota bacterium]
MSSGTRKQGGAAWLREVQKNLTTLPILMGLRPISVGDIWGQRFHTTPRNELLHVLEGNAEIRFRRRSFCVGPEDTFIIPQNTPHRDIRMHGANYRVLYVFFQWPGADALIRKMNPNLLIHAPAGVKSHLHMLMKELEGEYLGDASGASERMRLILLEALLALMRCLHRSESRIPEAKQALAQEQRKRLVTEARQYLVEHCHEMISLEALAARHQVSPFHLSRSFTREFGVAITDMLTMIRVERAKDLLNQGSLPIKEVAVRVGFADANYFAKVFRRVCGFSPTEHQANLLQSHRRNRAKNP